MTEPMDHGADPGRSGCRGTRALARRVIIASPGEPLPAEAEKHIASCPDCRAEVDEIARADAVLSRALRSARRAIPGPSSEEIDEILARVRELPPEAKLLAMLRRSVNRMLWLTLLVLSSLAILLVARAVLLYLKAKGG